MVENRLAAVERAVRELQARLGVGEQDPNWINRITGILKDSPAFGEVIELGRQIRSADRPA
jgi:hypothetical protein